MIRDPIFDYWMNVFERMKPFVDEGWNGAGWKPSELLVIGYSIVATGKTPKRADAWATMMLTKARKRYREGFSANPFSIAPIDAGTAETSGSARRARAGIAPKTQAFQRNSG